MNSLFVIVPYVCLFLCGGRLIKIRYKYAFFIFDVTLREYSRFLSLIFIFYVLSILLHMKKKTESMYNSLLQYESLFITFSIDTLPRLMRPSTLMTSLLTCHVLNPTDDIVFQLISFTSKAAIHLSMFPFSYLLSHVLLFSVCKS